MPKDAQPPWDGQKVDVREDDDEGLDGRVEIVLVEIAVSQAALIVARWHIEGKERLVVAGCLRNALRQFLAPAVSGEAEKEAEEGPKDDEAPDQDNNDDGNAKGHEHEPRPLARHCKEELVARQLKKVSVGRRPPVVARGGECRRNGHAWQGPSLRPERRGSLRSPTANPMSSLDGRFEW